MWYSARPAPVKACLRNPWQGSVSRARYKALNLPWLETLIETGLLDR